MRSALVATLVVSIHLPCAHGQNLPARTTVIPTSARVELQTSNPPALAAALEMRGFDRDSVKLSAGSLELIVNPEEFILLQQMGHRPLILELGRPLYDLLPALNDLDAPPAGYKDNAQLLVDMRAIETAYPSLVKVYDAAATWGPGSTHEGRPIWVAKISDNVTQDEDEPNVLVVSAHHCREIVTPVIAMHAIEQLTTLYATNTAVRAVVDANEIWIAPVWNPDGYNEVFVGNNLWRKNRKPYSGAIGVDLNRNYPMGWYSSCSGSTSASSDTYKGPSPASEAETQTMVGMSRARRFEKVLDYHSSGRETLYGYRCSAFPLQTWYQGEAVALSNAAGYSGAVRSASAEGEHYQWQLNEGGAYAFLTETHTQFQPTFSSAQAEAAQLWNEILFLLQKPVPLTGHVTDAGSGQPLAASIESDLVFTEGETRSSDGTSGRYFYWASPGTHQLTFSAAGYDPQTITVNFGATTQVVNVALSTQVLTVNHTPLEDTDQPFTPRLVEADIIATQGSVATAELWYSSGGPATSVAMVPSPIQADRWRALLPGLPMAGATDYHLVITHSNSSSKRLPAAGEYSYTITAQRIAFADDFESGAGGWTHGLVRRQDDWQIGSPTGKFGTSNGIAWADPGSAASGVNCWGNDIGISGYNGAYQEMTENWLRSPTLDLSGHTNVKLGFMRWLTVEDGTRDQATVSLNGVQVWQNPSGGGTQHTVDTAWVYQEIPLPQASNNPAVFLEWRLRSNSTGNLGGWNIDDIVVFSEGTVNQPDVEYTATPAQVGLGASSLLALQGTPQAAVLIFISDSPGPLVVPGLPPLGVGLGYFIIPGTLGASGGLSFSVSIPVDPTLRGYLVYTAALEISAGLQFGGSNPLFLLLGP